MQIEIDTVYSFHQQGRRSNQEDSRWPDSDHPSIDQATFAVCDGVGGHAKGEVASSTVCRQIGRLMRGHRNTDAFTQADLSEMLARAYDALDQASDPTNTGMGTTLALLCLHDGGAWLAHIGDSRIYQIRPQVGIVYRSEDHSLVNALVRSGSITPAEAKHHPKSNVITRCMSANDGTRDRDAATALDQQDVAPGDYFLLCTDGVTACIDDDELVGLYSDAGRSDIEKCQWLAQRCQGSHDNNTATQIRIGLVTVVPQSLGEAAEAAHHTISTTVEISPYKSENEITGLKNFLKSIIK